MAEQTPEQKFQDTLAEKLVAVGKVNAQLPVTDPSASQEQAMKNVAGAFTEPVLDFIREESQGASTQSDWNETDTASPAYIKNKPTIPSSEGFASKAELQAEASTRYSADAALQTAITAEENARKNADEAEASARAAAESALQTNIDAEKRARQDGDVAAQSSVSAGDNIKVTSVVQQDGHTDYKVSVADKQELKVASPVTFDSDTATLGFDNSEYAKQSDIPTDFYTKDETNTKIADAVSDKATKTELNDTAATLRSNIDTVQSNVDTVSSSLQNNYYTKSQVDGFLQNWSGFEVIPLGGSLPEASKAKLGKIYLWKKSEELADNYEEWISGGTAWSRIGEMSVDLSDYYTKEQTQRTFATLADATTLSTKIDEVDEKKLESVSVDGKTITGDGTASNPLKSTVDPDDGYELIGQNGISVSDNTENKQTIISGLSLETAINNIGSITTSNGSRITALETDISYKQDTLKAGDNITIADDGKTISATASVPEVKANIAFTLTSTDDDGVKTWTAPTITPEKYSMMQYNIYVSGSNFTATDQWGVILNGSNWTTGIRGNFSSWICGIPTTGVTFTVKTPSTVTSVRYSYMMFGYYT